MSIWGCCSGSHIIFRVTICLLCLHHSEWIIQQTHSPKSWSWNWEVLTPFPQSWQISSVLWEHWGIFSKQIPSSSPPLISLCLCQYHHAPYLSPALWSTLSILCGSYFCCHSGPNHLLLLLSFLTHRLTKSTVQLWTHGTAESQKDKQPLIHSSKTRLCLFVFL